MITEFYEDCEIFITGGSGAVGKALIEKLLRSCNVRCIYVLLRTKKNLSVEQRLEKIKQEKIFRLLRATKPQALDKLIGVPGDVALPKLDIPPEYVKLLENVSIFFHSAATIRFDEPIKAALTLNLGGTHEALKFAENLKNLKIFMHVSTFYSNPYLEHVEDKLYGSPMDWKFCLQQLKNNVDENILNIVTKKMIVGFPNTYCFTKNLAESLVNDYRDRVPVAIIRPSIVLQAVSDPEPGFPPSLAGAIGLFTLIAAGILKAVYHKDKVCLDVTPQDFCIKSMMYYAVRGRQEYDKGKPAVVPVFNVSSYGRFNQTLEQLEERMQRHKIWENNACEKNLLIPGCIFTASRLWYMIVVFTKQIPPAILADFLLKCFGRKPVVMSVARRSFFTLEVMNPFRMNMYTSNGLSLFDEFERDTEGTEFSIKTDIIATTTDEGLNGICSRLAEQIREALLNENPTTLERSRKILRAKKIIYNIIRCVLAYYLICLFYRFITN